MDMTKINNNDENNFDEETVVLAKSKKRNFLSLQWSFAIGGLLIGLGEVIYFLKFGKFIPVTTGLARMFSSVESNVTGTETVSRVYHPDVHWIIIGALLGAWLVGFLEKESRNWVKYSPGMLFVALLGGIIFGFGTRLGPGCTTHHIFGGLSVMAVSSWTIALLGLPFAFFAFKFVSWLGYGSYFKHQETRSTAQRCRALGLDDDHRLVLDDNYSPWKNPLRLIPFFLVGIVIISALYTGFFGSSPQSLGSGPLWPNIIRLLAGLVLGVGIAKGGVGTECGLMAPESLIVSEKQYKAMRIPYITQKMFKAQLPMSGILAAIIPLNIAVLVMYLFAGWPVPNAAPKPVGWGLHVGHLLAAPCLAIGSVFMIGCEIRSYGRVGLGYLTGLVGLLGFYLGYLPYVFFQKAIDGFIADHTFLRAKNIPELISSGERGQKIVAVVYTLALIGIFVLVVRYGARRLKITMKAYLTKSADEVSLKGVGDDG